MTTRNKTLFLLDAWRFDTASPQPLEGDPSWRPHCWFHCQRNASGLEEWLLQTDLAQGVVDAVLAEDTRPRFQKLGERGFLLILRGVNLNSGQAPDDMLSLRILYYDRSLITLRKRPFQGVAGVREMLAAGEGPLNAEEVLLAIIEQMHQSIEHLVAQSENDIDDLQEALASLNPEQQMDLSLMHRQLLKLNRFIKPQTTALIELTSSKLPLFEDPALAQHFINQKDVILRIIESIESHLEQVWMLREHMNHAHAEKMSRNTYWLSLSAAIFLPLTFLTGLLGVNLGGIPGGESEYGFAILCLLITGLGVLEFIFLRRMRFW